VLIRPSRHRETKEIWEKGGEEQSTRESFAAKVWEVTGGMYQGGKHVDMLYPKGDGVDDTDEEARTEIVEVWRVNEFVWTPVSALLSYRDFDRITHEDGTSCCEG